ncbi:MAG: 4Fe-4S dicluster domain-containing protein [Coriobacteriales bacterium]|jgi:anaerobic dimethyl sulfoxide reductase subunit B (iron-sulfur subunit)|nr:4Fe-4S dicluster domain-containing protein [Coriobacteriales bacterium]
MMAHLGFYFNQDNCIGCRACQIACKDVKNLSIGALFRKIRTFESGSYPEVALYHYSQACNHCSTPACVASCPTESLFIADDGTIQQDRSLCIACKRCMDSCPYSVPQYLQSDNLVSKCDSCVDLRTAGENPPCVDACNMRVLEFGDVEELKARHSSEELTIDFPFLADSSSTNPGTLVKPRSGALSTQYTEHLEV